MSPRHLRLLLAAGPVLLIAAAGVARYAQIGRQADGSILVPTGQLLRPAGTHINGTTVRWAWP